MIKKIFKFLRGLQQLSVRLNYIQESLGRIEARQIKYNTNIGISESEFKVYSQSGEDGIIQFLINNVNVATKKCIECGIENYLESNTRFLTLNNYWSGLIIDGDQANIDYIKKDPIYWRCQLTAVQSFITKDNINDIIKSNGFAGDIGILSVDIDGNDYWVFESINTVNPAIIIAEYNSFFGATANITIPYDPAFVRGAAHYSMIYYGASITALTKLAQKKGYALVATNWGGNNVFFVRNDLVGNLRVLSVSEAYRRSNYREVHDESGKLSYLPFELAQKTIFDMPVFDLDDNQVKKLSTVITNSPA